MKRYSTILTVMLCFMVVIDLKAQTYPLSDFAQVIFPKPNSVERNKIHEEGFEFLTQIKNGKLKIKEYKQKRDDDEIYLNTDGGRFIGTDKGEWGGKLWFVNTVLIKNGNIRFLFKYNHRIFFIESLHHLSLDKGTLFEIVIDGNIYKYQKILDFEDAPEVMCIVNGDILVASEYNFYQIHDLKKEKIFPDLLADDFFPRSLVATDANHVYMGVTGGYVQIDLIDKSYKFFQYKKGVSP